MLARIRNDKFLRDNASMFVSGLMAAFLNYLFHPILARFLSVENYGTVQALLSLQAAIVVPCAVIMTVVVNIVANSDSHEHGDDSRRSILLAKLNRLAEASIAVTVLVILALSRQISDFFSLPSPWLAVGLAATLPFVAPNSLRRAYLRGEQRFSKLSRLQIIEAAARLAFSVALVAVGWRAYGVLAGVVLTQAVVFGWLWRWTSGHLRVDAKVGLTWDGEVRRELHYAAMILLVTLSTRLFSAVDVLVVKHYFSPREAGLYGGVSTIAKIVLFITASADQVLLPAVKRGVSRRVNLKLLHKSLLISLGIGGLVAVVFAIEPSLPIFLLIGPNYLSGAWILPKLSLLMLVASLIGPLFQYHLALRDWRAAVVGPVTVTVALGLCVRWHESVGVVVDNLIIGSLLAIVSLLALAWIPAANSHE